jgi:nucleotide-binding universal stress UspA family protein
MSTPDQKPTLGPVLFAYDGSELAARAIEEAGRQLGPSRDAIVLCVWQPADVGFQPVDGHDLNASQATDVHNAAEAVAARGAQLAEQAGFRAQSLAVEASPSWKGICTVSEERGASLIVLGAHRRTGIVGHLLGSVTAAVVTHSSLPVLVIHPEGARPV